VPNNIADELGLVERPDQPLVTSLRRFLADKQLLLLLDNFEHVLAAAPLVAELLSEAPCLRIMITSRELLRLSGEHEYVVLPLAVPDLDQAMSVSQLADIESVILFLQRAQAGQTNFRLTEENAPAIAEICRRLDGLPLAIELAAARIKLFSPSQMLDQLVSRLGLLTTGPRDVPARQKTLRNTIDWSYYLLDQDEQILFACLGVFSGGGSLRAIETICGPDVHISTLDGLDSLMNKSLLNRIDGPGGEPRFGMLETIHEYALELLNGSNEEHSVRNRHLAFFLAMVEEAEPHLFGSEQVTWLDQLEIEQDNFRAALEWCQTAEDKAESGLRLTGSLASFWSSRSYYDEGREHLSAALSRPGALDRTAARAKALSAAGLMAYIQSDYPATRPLLEESLSIYKELGPACRRGLADALITLGDMETELGHYATASSLMKEALVIMRELEDARGIARALWQLGQCAVRPGDYEQAIQYFEMALPLLRQEGDRTHTAIALTGLAEVALRQGDYERATILEEESLTLRREIGETWGIAVSLGNFAWIALRRNDLNRAQALLAESLTLRREIGDIGGAAWCLEKFAEIAQITGQSASSSRRVMDSRRSARLFGAAHSLRTPIGSVIDLADQPANEHLIATIRARLDQETFISSWDEGEAMSLDEAVAYALEG
jgi:predicted ATPase